MSLKPKESDFVSDDRNWRSLISNELKSAQQWDEDWGFLVSGQVYENETIDSKIAKLEERLKQSNEGAFRTTSTVYGKGTNLEKFRVTDFNITKNPDLRPCDRKPRKNKR